MTRAVKTLLCFLTRLFADTDARAGGIGTIIIRYSGLHCVETARCLESFSNHKRACDFELKRYFE